MSHGAKTTTARISHPTGRLAGLRHGNHRVCPGAAGSETTAACVAVRRWAVRSASRDLFR